MGKIKWEHITRDNRQTIYKDRDIVAIRSSKNGIRGNWSLFELSDAPDAIHKHNVRTTDLCMVLQSHYKSE